MMKRNNKWIALLTAALMALSFAGCLVPEAKTPEANASASATDAAPAAPVEEGAVPRHDDVQFLRVVTMHPAQIVPPDRQQTGDRIPLPGRGKIAVTPARIE